MKNNSINSTTSAKLAFNTSLIMIGENIRKRRETMGMSQTELANEVGIERARISEYENGVRDMRLSKLHGIAHALDCEMTAILGRDDATQKASDGHEQLLTRIASLPAEEREKLWTALEYMVVGAEAGQKKR